MKKLLFVTLVLLLRTTLVIAQEPEYDYWVYLPLACRPSLPTATPTTTPTATPTPTPTSTPSPTATPTPVPSRVHILPNHSYFVDSIDYLEIVGEVQNDTSDYLRYVKIAVDIFGSGGQLLATDYTYTYMDNLSPGKKTCFKLWVEEPIGWSYYRFEKPTYWTDGESPPNLTIFNDSASYDPVYDWYEVIGQVRNDHNTEVRYVSPIVTLYNAAGTVVDCDFTYPNTYHLSPGQVSSFDKTFYSRGYADVTSYRLQVDGDPQ